MNALSTLNWSFEQDLALWETLGLHHAGLLAIKAPADPAKAKAKLGAIGITGTTVACSAFKLDDPETWEKGRADLNHALDLAKATGAVCVYMPSGRNTGAPWRDVLASFKEAVGPCIRYGETLGVRVGIEPMARQENSFVTSLRDAVDVAEITGVGIAVDFAHCWLERDLREVAARACPHICLVQICDIAIGRPAQVTSIERRHIGDGTLPLRRLVGELLDAGYTGLFDLEVYGPTTEAEGYVESLTRGVEQASGFLGTMGI